MTSLFTTTDLPAELLALVTPLPPDARRRVVVAMSGGVDSSVVAAMLHAQGHDVIGMTLQLYDHGTAVRKPGACCAGQDIQDARRVADIAGFPHYVLDYEDRFRDRVMAAFADSYLRGETPIPCVACNQQVKFADLLETARDLGADVLATGHYIVRRDAADGPALYRAHDAARDQSYFLFATTRAQLADLWFPLGSLPKSAVRQLAAALGLPVADKPDSQDICFVPTGRYASIIERLKPGAAQPGAIVHVDGRVLGQHTGIINFTIGQRRGLGLATGEPLFVTAIDAGRHQVIVGPRSALDTTELTLRDVNWIGSGSLADHAMRGGRVYARVRSTHDPEPATIHLNGAGTVTVTFAAPLSGIARGQACVFYGTAGAGARVLGGGFIEATAASAASISDSAVGSDGGAAAPTRFESAACADRDERRGDRAS